MYILKNAKEIGFNMFLRKSVLMYVCIYVGIRIIENALVSKD